MSSNIKFNFLIVLIFVCLFHPLISNELSRCCSGGSKHFREKGNCVSVKAVGSSHTCNRAGSICCLRSLIDASCNSGLLHAQRNKFCSALNINELAGGVKKECCDCCLLAKDLSENNEPCIAPIGFSPDCLESFNKCCNQTKTNYLSSSNVKSFVDLSLEKVRNASSCAIANCEHLCTIREDGTSQCGCRSGFDLAPDGRSCIDIDECKIYKQQNLNNFYSTQQILPLCDFKKEICINIIGGYGCRPKQNNNKKNILKNSQQRSKINSRFIYQTIENKEKKINSFWSEQKGQKIKAFIDINECITHGFIFCSELNTQCLNLQGTFSCVCSTGFYWSNVGNVCIDIDECLLLVDDCLESQRCLNTVYLTPGAYKCIRTKSCYAMDSETEQCVDVDECTLGAHDCGPMYQCKNTQGSFRCVPKKCEEDDQILDPGTGECKSVNCPLGYRPRDGSCEDIDECREQINACPIYEECVNTLGAFRCQEQGNVCSNGYYMDRESGFCLDIDECERGTHTCTNKEDCINLPGIYRCKCGSYQCICNPGFSLASDNRSCDDIDECNLGIAKCQQKCINSPGSYQCICDRGYQLGIDESTCEDIDECNIWAKSGNELCMGKCINTPGSFLCTCPSGYEVMSDGITCKDIDECNENLNLCDVDQLCINLLGSFKCERIECPRNYIPDRSRKLINTYLTLTSKYFSSPHFCYPFLNEVNAKQGHAAVTPALRANFLLQKGEDHNSAIIALRDSLDGPQEVHLELTLRLTTNGLFNGKYVANLLVFVSQYRPQTQHNSRLNRIRRF
ncbi:Fibulin-1 [Meloidogyne graminicola]|uniref:Fibulin-1 n=1 Tax=Meloidogyne graminicola TaxID=189291 RepID=A0A8T0A3J8_9BILA|nr:Fibulin-1 [Meloidogyne graminicola]